MRIPDSLAWWRDVPGGAAWLDALPATVDACCAQWSLTLGEPFAGGNVALVTAVTREDGARAVLKLSFPEPESEHEAAALGLWAGAGAARLLEHDPGRRAILLERVEPGTPLWDVEDDADATETAARVLRRLHAVPVPETHPFRPLADAASQWAESIPADWEASGRRYPRSLVDVAVDACRSLDAAAGAVVLHQDFHGGNVLRGADDWLAIDPKPLVGDPAFDAASLLRDRRWLIGSQDDAARIRRRLDQLVELAGLDRERMRLWGVVHALAWGVSGVTVEPDMIRCAEALAAM